MAAPKVIYKSAKVVPAVKATRSSTSKMPSEQKRVIAIASITLFAVLILGLFLFFGQKFVGKAIAFDTSTIGVNQIGIPVSGSAEVGDVANLPVYVNLGAEKSYAFKVTVSASPFENVEWVEKVVPPGIIILEEDYSVPGAVTFVGVSLSDPTDEESPPLALTGLVNLFDMHFKALSVTESVVVKIEEVEMYDENGETITLMKKEATFAIVEKVGICGDGKKEGKEECDDGNLVDGDGCTSTCVFQCSDEDGAVSLTEAHFVKSKTYGRDPDTSKLGWKEDYCVSLEIIGEYWCQEDGKTYFGSSVSCPVGTSCYQGACVVPEGSSCADISDADKDKAICNDNCPGIANANQADTDEDGIGDACDTVPCGSNAHKNNYNQCICDANGLNPNIVWSDGCEVCAGGYTLLNGACVSDKDNDGLINSADNCWEQANADQKDSDGDGKGDVCDVESCGSFGQLQNGECICIMNHVNANNLWSDGCETCADGYFKKGSACLKDTDGDGVDDSVDNCVNVANAGDGQVDKDYDGLGNACDDTPCGDNAQVVGVYQCGCQAGWENADNNWANGCEKEIIAVAKGDSSGDGCVSMPEVMSYIGEWKKGVVSMPDLMSGIGNWKKGGC